MKSFLPHVLYPILLALPVGGAAWVYAVADVPVMVLASGAVAAAGAVIWLLEYLLPYDENWKPEGWRLGLDVLHTAVSSVIAGAMKTAVMLGLAMWLDPHLGLGLWPSSWPLWAQVVLAVPVADLGIYLGHRWMHTSNIGWRVHAVHHSPSKLHFWASARTHPFNAVVKVVCESGPLLVLGIGPDAYAFWLIFMSVNGMLEHANIELRPGVLSYVLATNIVHRGHHSRERAWSDSNYGNTTMLWDLLFGTFKMPKAPVHEVGAGGYAIPENYSAHLAAPFVLSRFEVRE